MSEQLNIQYLQLMAMYSHRMASGTSLMEFEVMAYEQICRAVQSIAEYTRICIDDAISKVPTKEE